MPSPRRSPRTFEAMQITGFVFLHSEAPRLAGRSYATLARLRDEGRLLVYGRPEKVKYDHLLYQLQHDFPVCEFPKSA